MKAEFFKKEIENCLNKLNLKSKDIDNFEDVLLSLCIQAS